jgi:hypothetical protein
VIAAYVPEAGRLSRADALELAIERDGDAAEELYLDAQNT